MQEAASHHGVLSAHAAFESGAGPPTKAAAAFEVATRAHFASTRALLAAGKDEEAAQVSAAQLPCSTLVNAGSHVFFTVCSDNAAPIHRHSSRGVGSYRK